MGLGRGSCSSAKWDSEGGDGARVGCRSSREKRYLPKLSQLTLLMDQDSF